MKIGHIACAFGKHSIDETAIKGRFGYRVGRCRRCSTALEERFHNDWGVLQKRDAGLDYRL